MRRYFEKLYKEGFTSFVHVLEESVKNGEKKIVITANPETFMIGAERSDFDEVLTSEDTLILPDGIGVVKGATSLGYAVKERVAGVEIVEALLNILDVNAKTLYLLGAREEVLEQLIYKIRCDYPGIQVVGYQNGYVHDKDKVFEEIVDLRPDVVLVALGIPAQELLIYKHYQKFQKGIFIGVGGSFDVLSGVKKRAPKLFIKLNLEWLYRIMKEPKRISRFYRSNIKFILKIREMRKGK